MGLVADPTSRGSTVTTTSIPLAAPERMSLATRAVHAGRAGLTEAGVHVPAIDLSTTNPLAGIESGGAS